MPYCTYCGNQISDVATSCPRCGHPTAPGARNHPAGKVEGLAIASLVLGIAGFVLCPLVCSIIAVILGSHARSRIRQDPTLGGDALARAGLILGWVGIGLASLAIIALVLVELLAPGAFRDGSNIHVLGSLTV